MPLTGVAVVGDDPALEMPMARRGNALAIAVSTGIGAAAAFDRLPGAHSPHLRVHGVGELLSICRQIT